MRRAFVAISLPPEILDDLEAGVRSLEELGLSGRGVRRSAMHLTLKFLGDTGADQLLQVATVLRRLAGGMGPFEVAMKGTDAFPHRKGARVVFVGVRRCSALLGLQGAIEDHLSVLGVKREAREYRAHLTLMRLKSRKHLSRLQDWFKRQLQVSGMSFPVNHFHLYQSVLKPEGAEYRVLETFPLGNPPLP